MTSFMFEGQFQLNVHKTDLRNVNKCFPFARAFKENGSLGDESNYQQKKKRYYRKKFIKLAFSVHFCSVLFFFFFLQTNISNLRLFNNIYT